MLQGEGEWHGVLSVMLCIGVIAPHYHWVKENAIDISGYWKSLPVKLQVTDSSTHGTQCERKKSKREQQKDRVCVYVLPKDSNTYLSLKVASVKPPSQFKEW